eukprot:COSAG06_NODE_14616_length_1142_cov_1.726750_2_plen_133_part_00
MGALPHSSGQPTPLAAILSLARSAPGAPQIPHCQAVPVLELVSEAEKNQRTVSDALGTQKRGTVAGDRERSATSALSGLDLGLDSGLQVTFNRLSATVRHAVGTGELDLLRQCEGYMDQLQAHCRIPAPLGT